MTSPSPTAYPTASSPFESFNPASSTSPIARAHPIPIPGAAEASFDPFSPFGSHLVDPGAFQRELEALQAQQAAAGQSQQQQGSGPTPFYAQSFASSTSSLLSNFSPLGQAQPVPPEQPFNPFAFAASSSPGAHTQGYDRLQSLTQAGQDYDPTRPAERRSSTNPFEDFQAAQAAAAAHAGGIFSGRILTDFEQAVEHVISSSPGSSNPSSNHGSPFSAPGEGSPLFANAPPHSASQASPGSLSGVDPPSRIPELDISLDPISLASSAQHPPQPPHRPPLFLQQMASPSLRLDIPGEPSPEIQLTLPTPKSARAPAVPGGFAQHVKQEEEDAEMSAASPDAAGSSPGSMDEQKPAVGGGGGPPRPKGQNTLEVERMLENLIPSAGLMNPSPLASEPVTFSDEPGALDADAAGASSATPQPPSQSTDPSKPGFVRTAPKRQRSKSDGSLPAKSEFLTSLGLTDYAWPTNYPAGVSSVGGVSAAGFGSNPFAAPGVLTGDPTQAAAFAPLFAPPAAYPTFMSPQGQFVAPAMMGGEGATTAEPVDVGFGGHQVDDGGRRRGSHEGRARPSPYDAGFLSPGGTGRSRSIGASARPRHARGHSDVSGLLASFERSAAGGGMLDPNHPNFNSMQGGYLAPPGLRAAVPTVPAVPLGSELASLAFSSPFFAQPGFTPGVSMGMDDSGQGGSPSNSDGGSPSASAGSRGRGGSQGSGGMPIDYASKTTQATKNAAIQRRKPGTVARFKCEYCGETFTRHYNLKGHIRAHKNEKPYTCEFPGCEKAFARAHDRKRHQLLHTGEKKYKCDVCQTAFVRLDALQRHHKSENGQQCVQILQSRGAVFNEDGVMTRQPTFDPNMPGGPSGGVLM